MRRWLLRILIGLVGLIALIVIVVQIVLWTNIPKDLVVAQIEREMGLRISTDRLTTGWLGRSTLSNVAIGLPLSQQSFLRVKTLQVKHTTLFGLLFGRAVSIDYIEVDEPTISLVQDSNGQWNLTEVAQLLARVGGGKTAEESQKEGIPKLPNVRLVNGTIQVTDSQNNTRKMGPLNVDGYSQGALVWNYDVKLADALSLVGKVAPGTTWKHQIQLSARNLDTLLKDWQVKSYNTTVTGDWQGQLVEGGGLTGTLNLAQFHASGVPAAGEVSVTGAVDVQAGGDGGAVTLRPRRIDLKTTNPTLRDVWIAAGTITKDSNGIRAQTVQIAGLGGLAVLDGAFDPRTMAGDFSARWNGLALTSGVNHSGSITASLRMPFPGHPLIKVDLASKGNTSSGQWSALVDVAGEGTSWKSIDWVITTPELHVIGKRSIEIAHLTGHITQRWPSVELTDLTLPTRPHLLTKAAINMATHNWYFWLDAGGAAPAAGFVLPINFSINAWGDSDLYTLHEMNLRVADASFWSTGTYDCHLPNPVNFDVYLIQSPELEANGPIQGHINGKFNISGLLFKEPDGFHPQLNIAGNLTSKDLIVLRRPVGNIDMQLTGAVNNLDMVVQTTEMDLLQGKWTFKANYPTSHFGVALKVDVRNLPVEQVAAFVKGPQAQLRDITGQISDASCRLEIPHSGGLSEMKLDSSYVIENLNVNGFPVDRIEAKATLDNGLFKLGPMAAQQESGRFDGLVTYDLSNPVHVLTDFKVDKWPYGTPGGATFALSGATKLDIDLKQRGASGPLSGALDVQFRGAPLAHAELDGDLRDRLVSVKKLGGNILTGAFDGNANFDLDKPLEANGQVKWLNIDSAALTELFPALEGLGGTYSGTVTIGPAREPRPLEPVRIDINIDAHDGHFRSVRIGDTGLIPVRAVAYANTDRIVLDHSDIRIAGGLVHLWARAGKNLASQGAQISFENVELDQIAHIDPTRARTQAMPGYLNGQFALVGSGLNTDLMLGQGRINLSQADLGNFGPIAALYAAMNIGASPDPSGTGRVDLRLEQNQLKVTRFSYYNRGVDAHGIFNVGPSIWNIPYTPVSGQVVGTARPLKNTRVSLLADFDQILSQIQAGLTTVNVRGPDLHHVQYPIASFEEIGNSLRSILVGDARAAGGSSN